MTQVSLEYTKSHEALDWAKENCPNYITNHVDPISFADHNILGTIWVRFYFGDDKDATLFALRWK